MWLQVYIATVVVGFALSDGDEAARRTVQVPFIADAVGNALPKPSELPSKVGSPSNLLSPDRYEFYTFDESGELVKRLMTLDEIQAIVAAGEGNDGHMVTFADDDKPTIAFNFSQPPFTKIHNVVTNVQNVLKEQMEAQKKNPPRPTTFDTPDVSNSWSMILPSIFGNTGVDIVPDKLPSNFGTPETETIYAGTKPNVQESNTNTLNKDDIDDIGSAVVMKEEQSKSELNDGTTSIATTEKPTPSTLLTPQPTRTTTSATAKLTSTTSTAKPTTTRSTEKTTNIIVRTSPNLKSTTTTTTINPSTSTIITNKLPPTTTTSTTTNLPIITTDTSMATNVESTKQKNDEKFEIFSSSKPNQVAVTKKQEATSKQPFFSENESHITPVTTSEKTYIELTRPTSTAKPPTTKQPTIIQVTTPNSAIINNVPVSVMPEATQKQSTSQFTVTTYRPSIHISTSENPKLSTTTSQFDSINNRTTLTTQSVSPSTSHITTDEITTSQNYTKDPSDEVKDNKNINNIINASQIEQELIPSFDVAQSISQIASDLGNNFVASNNEDGLGVEIKENVELDIPEVSTEIAEVDMEQKNITFVKISTIDPFISNVKSTKKPASSTPAAIMENNVPNTIQPDVSEPGIIPTTPSNLVLDLSDSMTDLLSQVAGNQNVMQTTVVNDLPPTENILNRENDMDIIITTIKPHGFDMPTTTSNLLDVKNYTVNSKVDNVLFTNHTIVRDQVILMPVTSMPLTTVSEELTTNGSFNEYNVDKKVTNKVGNGVHQADSTSNMEHDEISSNKSVSSIGSKDSILADSSTKYNTKENITKHENSKFDINQQNLQETTPRDNINTSTQTEYYNENSTPITNGEKLNAKLDVEQPTKGSVPVKVVETKKKIQKVNIDDKELVENSKNNTWKLVSTMSPPNSNDIPFVTSYTPENIKDSAPEYFNDPSKEINLDGSTENQGLEVTIKNLEEDVYQFTDLCNELAFRYWSAAVENLDMKRSFVLSPYSITSMLAMMFMGARGATSGEMNEILKLDDMVTFNPHFTLKNISDSIETSPETGVAVSAFIRELYSDRNRGKLLTFYKERAQHFYNGHVEEINFKLINDIIRRRTNLLVKRYTWGKISEYIKTNNLAMKAPLAAFSANIFETDCTGSSVDGRDGEMYFVVSPSVRQRRLVPVPAVVYKAGFLAGYDPVLDATAASIGTASSTISTIFLMPGQQGNAVHADDLEKLEKKLLDSIPSAPEWYRLLRTLLPRPGLELQIPRFSHRSVFNVSSTLRSMGLKDLFDQEKADLGGLNGPSKDLYLSDMVQTTSFVTCGEGLVGDQHHVEEYPEITDAGRRRRTLRWTSVWDEPRDYQRAFHDPHDVGASALPLHLRPRQARLPSRSAPPQPARLKYDRPFLYFVRHNPSGMILYVGRYNPRLLP